MEGEGSSRAIRLDLSKNEGECWWPYVIEGEPSIDVTKIDPDPVGLDALSGDLRAQVEKMMVVQTERYLDVVRPAGQGKVSFRHEQNRQRKDALLVYGASTHLILNLLLAS